MKINMFPSPLLLISYLPKSVKPFIRFGQGNKEPNLTCIHPKKLLVKEVLTLHQSSQVERDQNYKKSILAV